MIKLIKILLLGVMFLFLQAATKWVKIEGDKQPCFNSDGRVLQTQKRITYNKNQARVNYGCGWIFPDVSNMNPLQSYKHKGFMFIETQKSLASHLSDKTIKVFRYKTKHKKHNPVEARSYELRDFNPILLTKEEAEVLLKEWGAWTEIESCVTCPSEGE